jgi:hypothetical protein
MFLTEVRMKRLTESILQETATLPEGTPITAKMWLHLGNRAALVQIPNPVSYLVQKILIHERREIGNRAKDLLYMHDTIEVFGSALPELKKVWHESVRPLLSAKAMRSVESAPKVLFGEVSDAIREAARMATGRVVSPAQLMETCEAGLSAILA